MLKYGNRFYTPYDTPSHNYPYMQNRRLSTILSRYRWRARSAYHRPQLIIGLIWICIIIAILIYVQVLPTRDPTLDPGLPMSPLYAHSHHHSPTGRCAVLPQQFRRLDNCILQPLWDIRCVIIPILHALTEQRSDLAECDKSTPTVEQGHSQRGQSLGSGSIQSGAVSKIAVAEIAKRLQGLTSRVLPKIFATQIFDLVGPLMPLPLPTVIGIGPDRTGTAGPID